MLLYKKGEFIMEEIFSILPFNTYKDLFNAINNKKATIKLMRSDCVQIAGIKHPYFSSFGMYIGCLITLIINIYLSIILSNYWLLLLIIPTIILNLFIIFVPKLKYIAWIIFLFDLFIVRLPNFITFTCINIILVFFFYNIWWNKTYKYAIKELEFNEEAFIWTWNRCGIGIEDSFGNTYSKLNMTNSYSGINK